MDLRRALLAPSEERWDNAHNLALRSDGVRLSLWQAVVAVDPAFSGTKRAGRGGWLRARISSPRPGQLLRARGEGKAGRAQRAVTRR